MKVHVIDLDGSIVGQSFIRKRLADGSARTIPATDLAPQLRIVAAPSALESLKKRIRGTMGERSDQREIVFYGSGDFHHITVCLLERHTEPVTVVQFDNHPDWVTFPTTLNCGSWVNHALKLPHVAQVVTLGPAGNDLDWPELKAGNLRAVVDGRLKIVPWRKTRSRVFGRYGNTSSWRQRGKTLEWLDISERPWSEMVERLVADVRTDAVYVTIDKDALVRTEAATNWDQGCMTLAQVESLLTAFAARKRILGVDVCGDHSPPRFQDLFRRTLSFVDRGRIEVTADDLALNAATNARLLTILAALAPSGLTRRLPHAG